MSATGSDKAARQRLDASVSAGGRSPMAVRRPGVAAAPRTLVSGLVATDVRNDHIAKIQARIDAEKDKLDVSRAQHRAELAESDAIEAVDFALMAIEWAEWAVVDAELARMEADELAGALV